MSATEFDAVLLLVNHISPERCEAARLALVEGHTQQSIAERYGWGRTAVDNAERVVWRMFGRYLKAKKIEESAKPRLPRGWSSATIAGPRALVKKAEREVAAAVSTTPARR